MGAGEMGTLQVTGNRNPSGPADPTKDVKAKKHREPDVANFREIGHVERTGPCVIKDS
jgi:hypothetical protein